MRGVEGFGIKQHLRTDRLLTLSEDLPLVSVAVDTRPRIQAALAEIDELAIHGLVTLERARMLTGRIEHVELPEDLHEATKLTIYVGRQQRAGDKPGLRGRRRRAAPPRRRRRDRPARRRRHRPRRPPAREVLRPQRRRPADDHRRRRRPAHRRRAARARRAPAPPARDARARPRLQTRRPAARRARADLPETDASGLGVWQKLMVYAASSPATDGSPLYTELLRALREAGAAGATSLRGIWGYHGDHQPHGDTFWQLSRDVPILTVIVDTPERIRRWFRSSTS